ncbi:hypothetical protein V1478_002092 [Vespula squamosa]|uniref:Uncharacterized protein n=1 Tax=Vespula squamosa TaxID=30214 RepID=A0ABD2BZ06_VESSQ
MNDLGSKVRQTQQGKLAASGKIEEASRSDRDTIANGESDSPLLPPLNSDVIAVFYVLLFFGLSRVESTELPSIFEVEDSINRTVNEVERLINENPSLPRLSRSDIVDILYNVTSKDLEGYGDEEKIEEGRKMYQRALMIVLPYKARESSENLKDLYTKPPIVQMISDSASGERLEMVFNDRSKENGGSSESIENFVENKSRYKNHRESYSEVRPEESLKKEALTPGSAPIRFSFNLESLESDRYTDRERTTIDDPIFLPTTAATTVDDYPVRDVDLVLDTRDDNERSTVEELTIDSSPSKSKQDILYSDQWRYHAPPPKTIPEEEIEDPSSVGKTATKYPEMERSTVFVTPLSFNSQGPKFNTTLVLNSGGFRRVTSGSTSTERTRTEPARQEVMDLLASIGLRPKENEGNVENVFDGRKNALYDRFKIPNANGIAYPDATTSLIATTSDRDSLPSSEDQNIFETGTFDLNKGMENLTPDVRLLFQRFGLQSSNDGRPTTVATAATTRRAPTNSYKSFKPLPTSSTVQDEEMREFFARFGLGLNRQGKAMNTEIPSVIEVVPAEMRTILENIGLISNSRRNSNNSINYTLEETKSKYHVFKPHETTLNDDYQRSRINEFLDTVKLVQRGQADAKDFQKAATDLLENTKTLSGGPDPLSLEEIIRVYNEDLKNEVKRQEEEAPSSTSEQNSTESPSTTSGAGTTEESTTTSDLAKAPVESDTPTETTTSATTTSTTTSRNLLDLENSFGGSTRAPDPVLPAKRKSGLYFLVDWNTFLEVGEEGSEKIDLRFQPKVGDRSRFLPRLLYQTTKCQSIEETLEKVNKVLSVSVKSLQRRSLQDSVKSAPIWQEYEFGTNAGNREEVLVTGISIEEDSRLPRNEFNWMLLEKDGINYLACSEGTTFLLYTFDIRENATTRRFNKFDADGRVLTFALIDAEATRSHQENDIVVVLCVENRGVTSLRWYRILKQRLVLFWVWDIQQPTRDIRFVRHEGQNKLLLLFDRDHYGTPVSLINVYGFGLDFVEKDYDVWLIQRIQTSSILDMRICKVYERTLLALGGINEVLLYEHKGNDYVHGMFEFWQTIKSNDLNNFVCFESGHTQYLATSGRESALFRFSDNEFQYNSESEDFFNEVAWIEDVRIEGYRDESLLLVQLKNSTVRALAWQGDRFRETSLPNFLLDSFDLSTVTAIPRYGFVSGNRFVKIDTRLNELANPIEDKIAGMIRAKALLEELLNKQEKIIDEIDERFDLIDRINYTEIESFNASKIITTNLTVENDVFYTIGMDSKNFTSEDILTNVTWIKISLNDLTEKCHTLESNLKSAFDLNSTDVELAGDLDISGDLRIDGNLYVERFSTNSIDGLPTSEVLQNYLNDPSDYVIDGEKSFSNIEATNLTVRRINGIPIERIIFEGTTVDRSDTDFSKIQDVTIDGDLTFSKINNIDWERIVWKNKLAFIPGKTVVNGKIEAADFNVKTLNDLSYPYEYVLEEDPVPVDVTGIKNVDRLTVERLSRVFSINNVDINEFVTLEDDHVFKEEITFHNITVLGPFTINGKVSGFDVSRLEQEPLINETRSVSSNIVFYDLIVLGNIRLEDSINGKYWSDFDDLLSKNDSKIEIVGTKTFTGNVAIDGSIYIASDSINGRSIEEFVTLDTDQVFSNLKEISENVTLENVTYEYAKKVRKILEENTRENSNCVNKTIIFENTLIVDDLSFDILNNDIAGDTFGQKLNQTFQNISFNNLRVNELNVREISPKLINDVNLSDFMKFAVTRSTMQNLTGNYTFDRLEVEELEIERLNGMSVKQWNDLIDRLHRSYRNIFDGNATLESLAVKGMIYTPSINGILLDKMYDPETMGTVIFENDLYVENLTVYGLINNFNFTELVTNAALKTDQEITVNGLKEFENISCTFLEIKSFNGRNVQNLLDPYKDQDLTGPVIVNGTVNVVGNFDATGKINKVYFRDLINRVRKLDDETFELNSNVRFDDSIEIIDLTTDGTIDGMNFNEFNRSVVFKKEDNVTFTGAKRFQGSLTFDESFLIVEEALNDINLKEFYEKAIFIDKPFAINSSVLFQEDVVAEKNLEILETLDVKTIGGVDVVGLKDTIAYLDRPFFFPAPMTFTNINFNCDIKVKLWNNVDMDSIIPLATDQIISNGFVRALDVAVERIDIQRKINGYNLNEIYADTFMKIGDQNITGNLTFLGKVLMRHDFNPRLMNRVNPKQILLLNTNDTVIGNFEFEKPVVLNGSLRVLGRFNEIDLIGWHATAVTTDYLTEQLVSGKWKIRGNVHLKESVDNGGRLNGFNSSELADALIRNCMAMEASLTESTTKLPNLCKGALNAQYRAETQIYKFDAFEYLQVIDMEDHILSVHYFEIEDIDVLLISYETCRLDALQFTGRKFKSIASIPDFGRVDNWITLNHNDSLYFLVMGKQTCGRSSTNLWKLDSDRFVHVCQFDDVKDAKKLNDDTFLLLFADRLESRTIQQLYNNESFQSDPNYYLSIDEDRPLKFVSNTDRILLNNRRTIYELDEDLKNYTFSNNDMASKQIFAAEVGIFEREVFLHYDQSVTKDHIFISDNDFNRMKILQVIPTNDPTSFSIIHLEGSVETLLIFIENNASLKVYEYKGIQGFVHRDNIKIQAEKVSKLKIRRYDYMAKRHCLAVINKNRLTILEAKMHGERLDVPEVSSCLVP